MKKRRPTKRPESKLCLEHFIGFELDNLVELAAEKYIDDYENEGEVRQKIAYAMFNCAAGSIISVEGKYWFDAHVARIIAVHAGLDEEDEHKWVHDDDESEDED